MTDEEFLILITALHHRIIQLHSRLNARVTALERAEKAILLTDVVPTYNWRKALLGK